MPDVTATRRNGTLKYGVGLNVEQEITKDIGVFGRLGWNDGKTESFAFTAIDRLATAGVSVTGTRWKRPDDTVATEFTAGGISGVHASYLARGGLDFLIGDGKLRYGPESISETYYSARLFPRILRQPRPAAHRQSRLQPRPRTGVGGIPALAHGVRQGTCSPSLNQRVGGKRALLRLIL